jgi:hypothetical protein
VGPPVGVRFGRQLPPIRHHYAIHLVAIYIVKTVHGVPLLLHRRSKEPLNSGIAFPVRRGHDAVCRALLLVIADGNPCTPIFVLLLLLLLFVAPALCWLGPAEEQSQEREATTSRAMSAKHLVMVLGPSGGRRCGGSFWARDDASTTAFFLVYHFVDQGFRANWTMRFTGLYHW